MWLDPVILSVILEILLVPLLILVPVPILLLVECQWCRFSDCFWLYRVTNDVTGAGAVDSVAEDIVIGRFIRVGGVGSCHAEVKLVLLCSWCCCHAFVIDADDCSCHQYHVVACH